jgi:hypothetical protein
MSVLDAVLVGGIWDGKTFRVPDPPPPRVEVALPPPPITLAWLDEPDPDAPLPEFSVSYHYGGIRDDGVRWYWRR